MIASGIAKDLYKSKYSDKMTEDSFMHLLEHGLNLTSQNSNTDKLFVNIFYKDNDLKAVTVALEYNEEIMVRLLMQ